MTITTNASSGIYRTRVQMSIVQRKLGNGVHIIVITFVRGALGQLQNILSYGKSRIIICNTKMSTALLFLIGKLFFFNFWALIDKMFSMILPLRCKCFPTKTSLQKLKVSVVAVTQNHKDKTRFIGSSMSLQEK